MAGWIGVDFDGTLSMYPDSFWNGLEEIGRPVPLMVSRVKNWLSQGYEVRIFTARASPLNPDTENDIKLIQDWCLRHIGQALPVTNQKDFGMIELWDDRAVQVRMNTGERVGE